MQTVIVTYRGEGRMYQAETNSALVLLMYKSCRDFDVSPARVAFYSASHFVCSEEDTLDNFEDEKVSGIIQLTLKDTDPELENSKVDAEAAEIAKNDLAEPVAVDVSFETEGYRSLTSTAWVRPKDTLASVVGKFVMKGLLPFGIDVQINGESVAKSASDDCTDTYATGLVADALLGNVSGDLLISECGLSKGDSLRLISTRSRTAISSVEKTVDIMLGEKDPLSQKFYTNDTFGKLMGELLMKGHLDVDLDLMKEGKSVIRQYLHDKNLLDNETEETPWKEMFRDLIHDLPLGDLDIDDGDKLTISKRDLKEERTPTGADGDASTKPVKIKLIVQPGAEVVEKTILPTDTVASLIGDIVTRDDFSWSIDLFRGEDSILEDDEDNASQRSKPPAEKLLISECNVKDGEELMLTLCFGSGDDDENAVGTTEPEKPVFNLNVLVDEVHRSRRLRLSATPSTTVAHVVGELIMKDYFTCPIAIRKGKDLIFEVSPEGPRTSKRIYATTTLSEAAFKVNDEFVVSKRGRDQDIVVPIAFNDKPVSLLAVRVAPELTASQLTERLMASGLFSKITGLKFGCLYGVSPEKLAADKRSLIRALSVNQSTVIRVFASMSAGNVVDKTPASNNSGEATNNSQKREEGSLKRKIEEIGPSAYPPVKLTLTAQTADKIEASKIQAKPAKYEAYIVIHQADKLADINKVIPLSELSVTSLKKEIEKSIGIPVNDQYMIWQTTCGTEGKPFYIEVWQETQNRCWAREDTGQLLKRVDDNSETRIYHLHDDSNVKIPPNGRPLIRVRSAVEFYQFDSAGKLSHVKDLMPFKDKSTVSWISGLLIRNPQSNENPHFYMQASMGFVCTLTGGQFTKVTIQQTKNSGNPKNIIAYFVALIKNESKIPCYPFRSTIRLHVWTRPGINLELSKLDKVVRVKGNYVQKNENAWMIYRSRAMSSFEVSLSEHFKK